MTTIKIIPTILSDGSKVYAVEVRSPFSWASYDAVSEQDAIALAYAMRDALRAHTNEDVEVE